MDEDRTKGKAKDVVGSAKEKLGKATGDKDTEAEGHKDQASSSLKDAGENVKDAFKRD